jgi:hypothetical protein
LILGIFLACRKRVKTLRFTNLQCAYSYWLFEQFVLIWKCGLAAMALNFGIAGGVSGTASIPETESGLALGSVFFWVSQDRLRYGKHTGDEDRFGVGVGVLFDIADCVSGTASVPETEISAVLVLGLVCFSVLQILSPVRLAYRRQEAVRFWC